MTKNPWSKEELEILHNFYPIEGKLVLDKLPNRTYSALRQKACYDGIKFEGITSIGQSAWTEKEIDTLTRLYPVLGSKVCDYFPNRTVDSVLNKATRLKLVTENGSKTIKECTTVYIVYFPCLDLYKVGITKNVLKRIKQFGTEAHVVYDKNCKDHISAKSLEKELLSMVEKISSGLLTTGNTETFKATKEEVEALGKYFA